MYGDMNDIMKAMLGGGMSRSRKQHRGQDIGLQYPVSLAALYTGKTVTVEHEKTVLCGSCNGSGSCRPGVSATCTACRGQGMRLITRQIGQMIQQMTGKCDVCNGSGVNIAPADMCKKCNGKRVTTEKVTYPVKIEKGMTNDQQIRFPKEGDQDPDIEVPGDFVVVLKQMKDDMFTRSGSNLEMKHKITLAEALCGFQFVITHMDGRKLLVKSEPGQMIKPGSKKCIVGEGMPVYKKPYEKGDLIVEFEVNFPERLETSQVESLATVLPKGNFTSEPFEDPDSVVYVNRQPLDDVRKELNEEDDDDEEAQGATVCTPS